MTMRPGLPVRALVGAEQIAERARDVVDAEEVDLELAAQFVGVEVKQRARHGDAGIVDEAEERRLTERGGDLRGAGANGGLHRRHRRGAA